MRPRTVLYESFAGNGALCNPEAIFRELIASPEFADLRHTWVLNKASRHTEIRKEFARNPRVRFVTYRSLRYYAALAKSAYLFNNATFPREFSKRDGQVYVNTWHGTPLKSMGYDMPRGALESANTLRNFMSADFLLSQNRFMTERMYESAYKLKGAYQGTVIEEGYPRVDRQFLSDEELGATRKRLEAAGVDLGDREIVLYAPTWKGSRFSAPDDDARELMLAVQELQEHLGTEQYVVLLKTHQSVHQYAAVLPELASVLVPNDIPTNVMLGLSSVLITDFSSIFFDFLATQRPIIFYRPDADEYEESRGTYFGPGDVPGPVLRELALVADAILDHDGGLTSLTETTQYQSWRERFSSLDDGSVTTRVIDAVFRGQSNPERSFSIATSERIPILLFLGGMKSNGITTSALNLLASIDHERYDVSIVITRPWGAQQRANQARIDPRVRQFHRTGGMNGSKFAHLRRRLAVRLAKGHVHRDSPAQSRLWADEWVRCFGDARFDAVVDFSGYSPFWSTLFLHSPAAARSIWQHNDMAAEEHRDILGRKPMTRGLRAVFSLYSQFDRLVSVSPTLRDINAAALSERYAIPADSFVSARNLVDEDRILAGLNKDLHQMLGRRVDQDSDERVAPEWVDELVNHTVPSWFVTVGRFSTEKNQERLLRAFAKVYAKHHEARLVLIGYGPLREVLERTIDELGLQNAAFLAGSQSNPFPIIAAADCFVLSSNYEGQPMVLLEAAVVGLPIVSVRFKSVRDSLAEGEIHIVEQDDDALAEGMIAFLDGRVASANLEVTEYNHEAAAEFFAAVLPA